MNTTQCVPFEGCKFTIPISLKNGPSLKKIATSFKERDGIAY